MDTSSPFGPVTTPELKQQIWFRQTVYTLSLALILGIALSAVTIVMDLLDEQVAARTNARSVAGAMRHQAAQAVFNIDPTLAKTVTKGLSEYDQFRTVEIIDDLQETLSIHTRPPVVGPLSSIADFLFETKTPVIVPLYYPGVTESIGRIKVQLDSYLVAKDFLNRSIRTIIGSLIRNILLSGGLLILFYYTLTRPLVSVARQISEIHPENPKGTLAVPPLHANSELGLMTELLNNVLERLQRVQKQQRQAEQNLIQYQVFLEDIVAQRTRELVTVNRKLAEQAAQDPLTGIMNRRSFFEAGSTILEQARQHTHPVSLMMLDLDHFKSVNDTHGHTTGDMVLKGFVDCVGSSIRGTDLFARMGGEEFVLLMDGMDETQAKALGRRICENFASHAYTIGEEVHHFTVSIGLVSCIPTPATSLDSLTKAADEAMYRAKENGRNRLEVYSPETHDETGLSIV